MSNEEKLEAASLRLVQMAKEMDLQIQTIHELGGRPAVHFKKFGYPFVKVSVIKVIVD